VGTVSLSAEICRFTLPETPNRPVRAIPLYVAPGKTLADQVELIECAVADRDRPRARIGVGGNSYRQTQHFFELVLNGENIGVLRHVASGPRHPASGMIRGALPGEFLDLTHRELFAYCPLGQRSGVGMADQRTGMAHVEPALFEVLEHRLGQAQEPDEVDHVAARPADKARELAVLAV